jgi:hypothetical protein
MGYLAVVPNRYQIRFTTPIASVNETVLADVDTYMSSILFRGIKAIPEKRK